MRPGEEPGGPLPIRATAIVVGVWTATLLVIAFVGVPLVFSVCGAVAAP
ncbi:MAG TPA: hypothetical protein VIN34_10610 [Candidatus Limnocylindria bacterium]